jgi:hypothetical protein
LPKTRWTLQHIATSIVPILLAITELFWKHAAKFLEQIGAPSHLLL